MLITYTIFSSLHAMTTSPRTGPEGISLRAMQSSSCSGKWSLPVMLVVDLSLARVVQHSPFQLYALPTLQLSQRSIVQCGRMCMRMTTITLRVQNLTLSSLK